MDVLCVDIGSGGVTAARFNEALQASSLREIPWDLHRDAQGRATLSAEAVESALQQLTRPLHAEPPPAAMAVACFMHSFLVLSSCCAPLTPIFTWLDTTAPEGMDAVRARLGNGFHARTGCHYHPMFPVFKLAAGPAGRGNRVASPKAWLAQELTGVFADDVGMASASGLLNVHSGEWDAELLAIAGLETPDLPCVCEPDAIVGSITNAASSRFGIPAGAPLVSGSGDGFLANVGSGCTSPQRIAVTLGTSGVARMMTSRPLLDPSAGTFCYRASKDAFLLGCASSNGGNVLDWARNEFGPLGPDVPDVPASDPLVFMPWMNGERSLEWNPDLRPAWHGRTPQHSPEQLSRAVAEGVLFNIAQYVEVIERQSGAAAAEIVVSGNGFLEPRLAVWLACLLGRELLHPESAGLATLRGAAFCAWRALGHDTAPAMERLLAQSRRVEAAADPALRDRFERFKALRAGL